MSNLQNEIGGLSAAEEFELLDALWESLETGTPALTDTQREVLDYSMAEYKQIPPPSFPGNKPRPACLSSSDIAGRMAAGSRPDANKSLG